MRILYAVPAGAPGTAAMVFAHAEIERVAAAGVIVETIRIDTRPTIPNLIEQARRIRRACREFAPDIVHAHFGTFTGFVTALGAVVPVVITFRGSDLNPSPSDGAIRNVLQKLLSQLAALRAAAVIVVSRRLRSRLWFQRTSVWVIPTGIDMARFAPGDKATARDALGWERGGWVILFNAGVAPAVKRLDIAERAAELVRKELPDARLHVLNGRTPHAELPIHMVAADCLIVASDYEGSPDIVKEAMACNLAIVSVDVGDVAERLDGVASGRIVARDPAAIARGVVELSRSTLLPDGRTKIAELDAWRVRDRIIDVYRDVIDRTGKRQRNQGA